MRQNKTISSSMALKLDHGKLKPAYLSAPLARMLSATRSGFNSDTDTIWKVAGAEQANQARLHVYGFLDFPTEDRHRVMEEIEHLILAFQAADDAFCDWQGLDPDTVDDQVRGLSAAFESEVLRVREFGAIKYSADNWKLGFSYKRGLNAALRHLNAFIGGEELDGESGLSHLAHAGCSLEHVIWTYDRLPREVWDDRFKGAIVTDETSRSVV